MYSPTPFYTAIINNDLEEISHQIEKEIINFQKEKDHALLLSFRFNKLEATQLLMSFGATINRKNTLSFLKEVASHNTTDCIQYLKEQGVDLHTNYNYTLELSVIYNNPIILKFLVDNGANIYANEHQILKSAIQNNSIACLTSLYDIYEDKDIFMDIVAWQIDTFKNQLKVKQETKDWFEVFSLQIKLNKNLKNENKTNSKTKGKI